MKPLTATRNLVVVLGDQLDPDSALFDGFDSIHDCVWMAEVKEESTHVWSSKMRTAVFLSAMRHFARECGRRGRMVMYRKIDDNPEVISLAGALRDTLRNVRPSQVIWMEPGDYRVKQSIHEALEALSITHECRMDRHFMCTSADFARHAIGRRQLRMEHFYREMRRRYGILVEADGEPVGGAWNYDVENRDSLGREGPPSDLMPPVSFSPDELTQEVIKDVARCFPDHPGELENFDWPVTGADAQRILDDFVENRLPDFGRFQDAMWTGQPWLWHSRLSVCLNLKLLDPRVVIEKAVDAWRTKKVRLASVEGFVRQILGWREYVRGIYWLKMPEYSRVNELGAQAGLPKFYWSGQCEMRCLKEAVGQTLKYGYAHHIQRLMVTGLYAQLLGVKPSEVHEWYLSVYVDAVEWVELPNTIGMSQHADGGLMASKPYVATGKYIQRMSNYCQGCRFDPAKAEGDNACPFTTLYWDFLARHETRLAANPRMSLQVKNLARIKPNSMKRIRERAAAIVAGDGQPPMPGVGQSLMDL